jgi:hypothetical protein
MKLSAEVLAARTTSLLDPVLTLYGSRSVILGTSDDSAGRDAQLTVALPADGTYFVTVTDAGDRGSAWHAYQLVVKEAP